jgi:hypothetical protein
VQLGLLEEVLGVLIAILEQFVAPQETVSAYVASEFPSLLGFVFNSIGLVLLAIGVFLTCMGVVVTVLLGFGNGGGGRGAGFLLVGVVVILVLGMVSVSGHVVDPEIVGVIRVVLLGASILSAKVCLGYSAYRSGFWSSRHILAFLAAIVIAVSAVYLVNLHGVALVVSCLLVGGSIALLGRDILEQTMNNHPLMCIGLMVMTTAGVVFEPEFVRRCMELVDPGELQPEYVYALVGYRCFSRVLFGASFWPGLAIGVVKRRRTIWKGVSGGGGT